MKYKCGCINTEHLPTGAFCRVTTCNEHLEESKYQHSKSPLEYLKSLGAIKDGVPNCKQYIEQLKEAIGSFPVARSHEDFVMEVGCGLSMYAPEILRTGYDYVGIDSNSSFCLATSKTFNVETICQDFDMVSISSNRIEIILSAHCLEHLNNAPQALEKMYGLLQPRGLLYLIIPDDSDPVNPDHVWFFKEFSLRKTIELAGFEIEKFVTRKYIEREQFFYVKAVKK